MLPPRARHPVTEQEYEVWAQRYLRGLTLEHFMESTPQATQRKITLESLDLVHARRPEVQVFNELLVQYPRPDFAKPGQVVPDNMVVVHPQPIQAVGSFNTALQPAGPFWVLEYVSKSNRRKDYEDNFDRYEKELRVPYFLLYYPDNTDLTLYRLEGDRYQAVPPNGHERYHIPELELELALVGEWVRYWFRGNLLPLPAELQAELDEVKRQADEAKRQAGEAVKRADAAERQAVTLQSDLDRERQARQEMEDELRRLRALLGQGPTPQS